MPIIVTCQCGKQLRAPDTSAGRKGKCPACGQAVLIPDETRPTDSKSPAKSTTAKSYRCADCGGVFPVTEVVKHSGKVVCRPCLHSAELLESSADGSNKTVLLASIAAASLLGIGLAIALFFIFKGGSEPTSSPEVMVAADTSSMEPSPDSVEESEPIPPPGKPPTSTTKRELQQASEDLKSAFIAGLKAAEELYWDYQPTQADEATTTKLLTDKRLVGDGVYTDAQYPQADLAGTWGLGILSSLSRDPKGRSANLRLYVQGEGIPREGLNKKLGVPRFQEEVSSVVHVVYGQVCVIYGEKDEFLGMVHFCPINIAKPSEKPESEAVTLANLDDESSSISQAEIDEPEEPVAPPVEAAQVVDSTEAKIHKYALKYNKGQNTSQTIVAMTRKTLVKKSDRPSKLKRLPRNLTGEVSYFAAHLGRHEVCMALQSSGTGRLFVDTDVDGDLGDEKHITGELTNPSGPNRSSPSYRFGPVAITVADPDPQTTVQLFIETNRPTVLYLYQAGYCSGRVRLGGKTYRLTAVDANLDGRYDGVVSFTSAGPDADYLAIDYNNNGRWDLNYADTMEIQPLTKMIHVQDAYYSIEVAPDGSSVSLGKVQPEFGTLQVGNPNTELTFLSDTGFHHLEGSDGKWRIPTGNYMSWNIVLHDDGDRRSKWTLGTNGKMGKLSNFEVRPEQTTTFKLGPPLVIATDAHKTKSSKTDATYVSIGFKLTGQGGEEYAAAAAINGQQRPPPDLEIIDASGRVLTAGKFEYG